MSEFAKIGFVGLGSMGLPMAVHLSAAGLPVTGYDLRPEATEALRQAGGSAACDARTCAENADALILMVVDGVQARQLLIDQGLAAAMAPGGVVALMATCLPEQVETLAADLAPLGVALLDAPVSGGVVGAQAATLTIMVAGEEAAQRRMHDAFAAMGAKIRNVGTRPGQGAVAKSVNQLLCGVHLAAAAEALSLAEALGLDTAVMLDIVSGSAASSWMLRDRGPRMLAAPADVTSAVDIFVKDLGIVAEAGKTARVPLPIAASALQMFLGASHAGDGRLDESQVIRAYRRLRGSNV